MAQVNESAEISSKNSDIIKEAGTAPIEVFHQSEDFRFLRRMCDKEDPYIGVSPANDVAPSRRATWLDEAFNIIEKEYGGRVRTHGLGVTSFNLMYKYPWTSADSASFAITAGFGRVMVFDPVKPKFHFTSVGTKPGTKTLQDILSINWEELKHLFPPFIEKRGQEKT